MVVIVSCARPAPTRRTRTVGTHPHNRGYDARDPTTPRAGRRSHRTYPEEARIHPTDGDNATQRADRVAGVLLGQACGDALGVPYEFGPPLPDDTEPRMRGGGLGHYAPGEWSDDTQMAVCIAEVTATGADLRDDEALDAVAERFLEWYAAAPADVGNQTRAVLDDARDRTGRPAQRLAGAAAALTARSAHTAGNGALMRTAVVALPFLGDDESLATAARRVASLTHADPLAGDACVLWCVAVDRAVREERFDGAWDGLAALPAQRRDRWRAWLDDARGARPREFNPNGFTVPALQAALAAVLSTAAPATDAPVSRGHLARATAAAVRAGHDTDTVAAIAGALLGARWGAGAVPADWRACVHGWPGLRAADLERLALRSAGIAPA